MFKKKQNKTSNFQKKNFLGGDLYFKTTPYATPRISASEAAAAADFRLAAEPMAWVGGG